MKKSELKDLVVEELRHKASELRDEIFRLRMKRSASALDNRMQIRTRKKDLARVLTYLQQKAEGEAN